MDGARILTHLQYGPAANLAMRSLRLPLAYSPTLLVIRTKPKWFPFRSRLGTRYFFSEYAMKAAFRERLKILNGRLQFALKITYTYEHSFVVFLNLVRFLESLRCEFG